MSSVPYQAYKSKRHSRNVSNPTAFTPPTTPPEKVQVSYENAATVITLPTISTPPVKSEEAPHTLQVISTAQDQKPLPPLVMSPAVRVVVEPPPSEQQPQEPEVQASSSETSIAPEQVQLPMTPPESPGTSTKAIPPVRPSISPVARKTSTFRHIRPPSTRSPLPSSPLRPPSSLPPFRTVSSSSNASASSVPSSPFRPAQSLQPSRMLSPGIGTPPALPPKQLLSPVNAPSHLRTVSDHSAFTFTSPLPGRSPSPSPSHLLAATAASPPPSNSSPLPQLSAPALTSASTSTSTSSSASSSQNPSRIVSPSPQSPAPGTPLPLAHTRRQEQQRPMAPYRAGFQPRGVHNPLTDTFLALRAQKRSVGRIERTKLDRRLEKLIQLHFPDPASANANDNGTANGSNSTVGHGHRPGSGGTLRRSSSLFDLDNFRNLDAGDLWRSVLTSSISSSSSSSSSSASAIREAEQRITPWEDDAAVSKCPSCSAGFHPLTNRKHHCRLCGRIMCSLPVTGPKGARPVKCSVLFVVDDGALEEVEEGIDYGVRKPSAAQSSTNGAGDGGSGKGKAKMNDEDKFLKSVRVCRDCRAVLTRYQFQHDLKQLPQFAKMHRTLESLERQIDASLGTFKDAVAALNLPSAHEISNGDVPFPKISPELIEARKQLTSAFGTYDKLATRIRDLPTGPRPSAANGGKDKSSKKAAAAGAIDAGKSQQRIQEAIRARAGLWLAEKMAEMPNLPTRPFTKKKHKSTPSSGVSTPTSDAGSINPVTGLLADPNSDLARKLQPLLEQEALLEGFVEEAHARRKFEDVKTLRANLGEIRMEIDRLIRESEVGADGKR